MRACPDYLPTPCEIAEKCATIRSRWTPAERRRRTVGESIKKDEQPWLPPMIDTSTCFAGVRRMALEV